MKIKSVIASAAACAIAVSAMAVTASAKVLNPKEGDDKYCMDITVPSGKTFADIYGFEMSYTGTAAEGQSNVGAICWQSSSKSWTQKEFSLTEGEKDLAIKDNKVKYVSDAPLFAADDEYAQVFVAQWTWDGANQMDFTVDSVKLLDKDGNELGGAAAETTTAPAAGDGATTTTTTTTTAAATTTTTAAGNNTGDAGVAVAVAGLALAGAAAFVARKKD